MGKIKGTPPYLSQISKMKIWNFLRFLCSNLLRWMLLIKRTQWLSRNMLQHNPTPFRCTKITALNIRGAPFYLVLKCTNEKKLIFLDCQTSELSCQLFYHKCEASTVICCKPFKELLKLGTSMQKKLRALHRVCFRHAKMKLLNLPEFLCPNLFRWMLRLPKNTLQHSSDFQASDFSCWLFIVYTKLQQLNFILSAFEVLSKLRKDTCGKN